MAKTDSIPPVSDDAASLPPAAASTPAVPEASAANAAALQALSSYFGAERWPKLIQRGERAGLNAEGIADLAGRMIATRKVHHATNERAALISAANGFLCVLGLVPTAADDKALESALAATAV
jgi:hypothetical protein